MVEVLVVAGCGTGIVFGVAYCRLLWDTYKLIQED